jgi:hypothetical protein
MLASRIAVDVAAWLRELGLDQYERAFLDNAIDAEVLPTLTADDLKDIGVTVVGHRRKLLNAIATLRERERLAGGEDVSPPALSSDRPGEAERRQLTVLFCDLVGSTALSVRLDPEEMQEVLRSYQNAVAGEVTRFEGHVAKFMGDGVLAYFGWPRAHEDEAERAVRAGLAIAKAVSQLSTPSGESLAARVGIASGLVVVGDLVGGARGGGGGRDAEPGGEAAGGGHARRRGDRGRHTAALGRAVRAARAWADPAQGLCPPGERV